MVQRLPEDLVINKQNSRTHSALQIDEIARSIEEFGFTNPVLIDNNNTIIAGHGRVSAARQLNLELIPTIQLDHLTKKQIKAYVIADNQLALNAGWDFDTLKSEIEELQELDFDIDLLGFDDDFLDQLFRNDEKESKLKDLSYDEVFNIVVACDNESDQEQKYNELILRGYRCQVQSL